MKIGFDAIAEALPELPPMPKGDLQDPVECIREISEAGFRQVAASSFDAAMPVQSAENFFGIMVRSGAPFAAMRKKLGEEGWARVSAKFLEVVRRSIPAGGTRLGAEAILTFGVR
jgi:hypothetical protein